MRRSSRAREIKMTSSKKNESSSKKNESSPRTFVVAITCALLCSPFAIEGTSATENNRRSPYGVTHSSSSTSDDARLLEVPPHPPPQLGSGGQRPESPARPRSSCTDCWRRHVASIRQPCAWKTGNYQKHKGEDVEENWILNHTL